MSLFSGPCFSPNPDRGSWDATYCEGYDAYYDGVSKDGCPYPDTNERVEGTQTLTCRGLRKDWLRGWELASEELDD